MQESLRVDQILPSFCFYDAIGTETRIIRDEIRSRGISSEIFAEEGAVPGESRPVSEYFRWQQANSLVIHHFSIGSLVPYYLMNHSGTVVTRYHNITPAHFFTYDHNRYARSRCVQGRSQFPLVRQFSDTCWSVSHFNALELKPLNFRKTRILPVMRNYESLLKVEPCARTSEILRKDGRRTILFVGRVIPNKSHHDLLFAMNQYLKYVDTDLRLICVGAVDTYYGKILLKNYANRTGLQVEFGPPQISSAPDVLFTGSVSDSQLVSYYQHADAFVCLSEHEGFCVPLIEAMNFGLPVLAHNAAAVPETLGQAGCIVNKKKPAEVIEGLCRVLKDKNYRERQKDLSKKRALEFSWARLREAFHSCLDQVLEEHLSSEPALQKSRWGFSLPPGCGTVLKKNEILKQPVH